jgi:hypothetical protein
MTRELIYSLEVAIVRCPGDGEEGAAVEMPTTIRYCDICRRWGATGTTHMCWRNWHRRLSDLLVALARNVRR